ncbi:MAG TPA: transposase family protein, partial [Ktedonobacteraceae bacterium]|nr:transposase family protein [Ktedonobacteraceae bacterium]
MRHQNASLRYQTRRDLLARALPRYRAASVAQKSLLLDAFCQMTGYARKSAIRLLNHLLEGSGPLRRPRTPTYSPEIQQALFLAWKATHYVCAKRFLPSLPNVVAMLEKRGHLQLSETERRQLLAMSVSTVERYLRTQRKPSLQSLSATVAGSLRKDQILVRIFTSWDEQHPGFVEMDLVMHCGDHLDGSFLYTLTLTDLATGWTECLPLPSKSAETVLAGLAQARTLFPFPLLGIDTDSGSEFLNEELIGYCEQERLTFTRARSGRKNDQNHVEQKNGAVVREAVGRVRLEGERAYEHLCEVYRALRLMVNYVQPSFKLQEIIPRGDRVRRVYDLAQTPLQRLLASDVLSEERELEVNTLAEQLDPLVLSEQLDILRHALLRTAQAASAEETGWAEEAVALASPSGLQARSSHILSPSPLALTSVFSQGLGYIDQSMYTDEENAWPPE